MNVAAKIWNLAKCAVTSWVTDRSSAAGAALAFYCAFSLAPLLIILLTVAGWIVGAEAAYGQLSDTLTQLFGRATAAVLLEAMKQSQESEGLAAAAVSIVSLIVGATTVFAALEEALDNIWHAQALAPTGVWGWLRVRILSFGVILAVGFLLLVSLSVTSALAALRSIIAARFTELVVVAALLDFVISLSLVAGLIAIIYRYLPSKRLPWRPVLIGAVVTALLFHLGRWLIGLYLANSTQPSAFGAAASFAAMLLWLYYSAQIFLLGAEFTACAGGVKEEKRPDAESVKER
ncbi:membrane protein [Steroidobacter agaridevorans]|uniref:Membrane protein n=1 Tax=Steroidobacter agaridevorans TaxID=2695856 RepID=A0A829YF56_9GAMM|nr:YihY/virulence factor BrkB family protein [Steroidobacter agaridevorans]GFE81478.1 membrane protein [Steroidobacter agaridevorans]GFE90223.1 membrane protein [Steroidobacter agaridevorans]